MPFLPLKEKPYKNVDSTGNSVAIEDFFDADKDDFYNNKKRKGLALFTDLGTGYPIDGIFNPIDTGVAVAVSDGRMFRILENQTFTEITGATLNKRVPVKMADFGDEGFFANKSRILQWVYTATTNSFITDPDAPTNVSHLGFLDQYLLALVVGSQRYEWSEVSDPIVWRGEFASAESRPDKIVALHTAFGEMLLPGTKTTEHHDTTLDPEAPFQRIPGTITERGSLSPYSLTQLDNSYMFLDEERRVIRLRGREPQVISNPFDSEFQDLQYVEDAIGIHYNVEGDTKYILTFPASDKTYVYDYKLDFWAPWSLWDEAKGVRNRWIGNCGVLVPEWKKYLVGSKEDGKIYEASGKYHDDDGNVIQSEIITGWIDWGTSYKKSCNMLRVHVKRGTGGLNTSSSLLVNYRDNGKTEWSSDKLIDLGIAGDNESFETFWNLATYRKRQWRFRTTGELLLVSAEEEFTVVQ
jgi:hypothetical protein